MKVQIKLLKNLKPNVKKVILRLYKNDGTGFLDIQNPTTGYLTACDMIAKATPVGRINSFGYFLQPWVVEFLDNEQNYNKFVEEVEENEI